MNKVWFVTGASAGIGAEVAKAALHAGHRVVATARNLEKLRSILGAELAEDRLALVSLDVSSEAQVKVAVETAVSRFGRVDVVVNNAGYSLIGNFETLTQEQIERQLATNFFGVLYVMRAALPILRRQRSGHIFNVSSLAGVIGFKHCSAYAASKFAVEGLSLSIAQEVEPFGIKVTLVEPGFIRTDLLAPQSISFGDIAIDDYGAPGDVKAYWGGLHRKQGGDPAKLAKALLELAAMEAPPKQFFAGSDAIATIAPDLQARLKEIQVHADLSKSTDGSFQT
jgi:NAD(P)-dependent dehydrogenase (short-subunit alcohol dehydrogenase family)